MARQVDAADDDLRRRGRNGAASSSRAARHHEFRPFEIVASASPRRRRAAASSRMTVLENLQMGANRADPNYFAADLERVFTLFRSSSSARDSAAARFRREQQMLAIGRALMSGRASALDEPSLGLAPRS